VLFRSLEVPLPFGSRFLALRARKPVRLPRPKVGELAHQTQGVGIFAQSANEGWRLQKIPKALAFGIFLSKPQAWYIIDAQSAAYIIKGGEPPLYIITRQRASFLRLDDIQRFALMIYRNKLRMIYTPLA